MRSDSTLKSEPNSLLSPSHAQSHRAPERLRRLSTRQRAIGALAFLLSLTLPCVPAGMSYAAVVAHPRIFLDPASLSALTQRAMEGTPEWKALRDRCNLYLTGTVEWPDGNNYPDTGSIGAGYQGDGYFPALLNVGLCYQVALLLSPSAAAQYAAKGADILTKMSAPDGPHKPDPLRDSGYGIRFYALGMAVGFDWLYAALTPELRSRVVTALNTWIQAFETGGFERDFPQGNYFAGYYAAKGVAALATEGDNAQAPAMWDDWLTRLHRSMVQPYYAVNLPGGGWPEGWNYGPLGTLNMAWPTLAAKTAKDLDLIGDSTWPFLFPLNSANFITHFAWPDLLSIEDSDAVYDSDNPTPTHPFLYTTEAGLQERWGSQFAPYIHSFARAVRTVQQPGLLGTDWDLWMSFLFWNDAAPELDYHTLTLSYHALGIEMAAVRSSWNKDAVWAEFKAGPYVNFPDNGEEYFDKGNLAIMNGSKAFVVNAPGALLRNTPGTSDGSAYYDKVYNDIFGDNSKRDLFNVLSTDQPTPWGQGNYLRSDGNRAGMSRFEDGDAYVFMEATHLEDNYPRNSGTTKTITSWTRDVVYLRPGTFVVYDRSAVSALSAARWMQFHLRRQPVRAAPPAPGVNRWNVGTGAAFVGTVQTIFPRGHADSIIDVFGGHKVYRLKIAQAPKAGAKEAQWLTVFDAAPTPGAVASAHPMSAADGNVQAGTVIGVLLRGASADRVVLALSGPASVPLTGAPVTGQIRYVVPAKATTHLLTGLPANMRYSVAVTVRGPNLVIDLIRQSTATDFDLGSAVTTTQAGVLFFRTSVSGKVAGWRS